MVSRIACVLVCFSIFFVIPTLFLAGTSFIIGSNNTNTQCDDNGHDIIRLSTWLFVNSTVSLTSIMLYILMIILFFTKEQYKYLVATIVIYVLNCCFVITWNIIGATELFKNASDCQSDAGNLWTIVLVSLIFQWVNLTLAFCLVRYDCSNITDITDDDKQNDDFISYETRNVIEIEPLLDSDQSI